MELQLEKLKVSIPDEENEVGESVRRFAEEVVLGAIRSEQMTAAQGRRILGLSRYEMDGFLKDNGVYFDYTIQDIEREREVLDKLLSK